MAELSLSMLPLNAEKSCLADSAEPKAELFGKFLRLSKGIHRATEV